MTSGQRRGIRGDSRGSQTQPVPSLRFGSSRPRPDRRTRPTQRPRQSDRSPLQPFLLHWDANLPRQASAATREAGEAGVKPGFWC